MLSARVAMLPQSIRRRVSRRVRSVRNAEACLEVQSSNRWRLLYAEELYVEGGRVLNELLLLEAKRL